MQPELTSALAGNDVDAVRRLLQQARAAQAADGASAAAVAPAPVAPAAAPAAAEPAAAPAIPAAQIQQLGLTLLATPVMGEPVWPAARALGCWLQQHPDTVAGHRVLELGAGCGAPGLLAAIAGAAEVVLTDGDESLLELLQRNTELNSERISCAVSQRRFDWRTDDVDALRASIDVLLAADVLFAPGDIQPLVQACAAMLSVQPSSRLLLARSNFFEELQPTLVAACEAAGLRLLHAEPASQGDEAAVLGFGWAADRNRTKE